jgi:tungstate transport system ATP-binding protein
MNEIVLRAHSLRRAYGGRNVVDIDEIELRRGEILALLGPNGSGKSTLFRLLLLIERADGGEIFLAGRSVHKGDDAARHRIAGVFQQPFLFAGTVRDNLGFGLAVRRVAAKERAQRISAAAGAFGIEPLLGAHVRTLSGGEAQRVALARAFALQPEVLLLDEPTANLDALVKRTFREDIERAARTQAGAVVLITHDMMEAFAVADRVAVLDAGRVVQTGTPEDLVNDPRTPFVASFTGAELLLDGVVATVAEDLIHIDVGGALVWATVPADHSWTPQSGMRAHVAYRPEDVMISAPDSAFEVSARNHYRLKIVSLTGSGGLVRVRLDGNPQLTALVTRTSVESLGLRPGRDVIAHLKATALRALRSA